jgi:GT2 family glycosyltransferase
MPQISVVISTLGNYTGLSRVLDTYECQRGDRDRLEVLVVVDAADPDPEAADRAIADRAFPLRRLRGDLPGLSANRNVGWRAAEAPLVLFTDNDTLADRDLVSEHLGWHRRHPDQKTAVLGHVRWAREVRVTPFMHWLDHGIQFDYPHIEGTDAGWGRFYGANVSVKAGLIEEVGGFDAKRLPYLYDDLDFGYRAGKLGMRLLYNRRAIVEHLREPDLEFWRSKMPRLAQAERQFVRIHPEIPPFFHRLFSDAAKRPPARGRGRRLIRFVPPGLPLLGPRAWTSAGLYYRQALAPHFLAAWEADEPPPAAGEVVAPHLLEHDATGDAEAATRSP